MDKVEYLPVQLENNGRWGMISPDGKMLFEDEFQEEPTVVIEGVFSVREGDTYSIYKASEKPEVIKDGDGFAAVGYATDGLIPVVRPDQRISIIKTNGDEVATLMPEGDREIVSAYQAFSDGLLLVQLSDGNFGFVDTEGKLVGKSNYADAYPYSEGYALVKTQGASEQENGKWQVIDTKGEIVCRLKEDWSLISNSIKDGVLVVKDANDNIAFMDLQGELNKLPKRVENIMGYDENYIVFVQDGKAGVMSRKDGEVVIRPRYDNIQLCSKDRFLIQDDEDILLMDKKGETIFKTDDYNSAIWLSQFGIIARERTTATFLDDEGKPRIKEDLYNIGLQSSHVPFLTSDYIDYNATASRVISNITDNGLRGYALGTSAATVFHGNTEEADNSTYYFDIDGLNQNGAQWRTEVKGELTWYPLRGYGGGFNPDANIENLKINFYANKDWGKRGLDAVVDQLKARGFTVSRETTGNSTGGGYYYLLNKGNTNIYCAVNDVDNGRQMRIIICKADDEGTNERMMSYQIEELMGSSNDLASIASAGPNSLAPSNSYDNFNELDGTDDLSDVY